MDPNKNPPTPQAAGAKKSTGIPTRSSGIPAPSVRRSVAPSGDTADENSKLQTSSSQKSLPGSHLKPPSAVPHPMTTSTLSASSSSSSVHQPTSTTPAASAVTSSSHITMSSPDPEVEALKSQVKDLSEKLETLKMKRAEDRDKLREAEKWRIQNQQLNEFKTQAQEIISNLNKEIQQTKADASSFKEQYESYKEEMNNHESRLEEMTVDKELAEAKIEELQEEIAKLSEKNEEIKLELDVLKGEIEMNGVEGAVSTFQNKQAEKETENLKAALIKYY